MSRKRGHPLFARAYALFSRSMEKEIGPYREELLSGLRGSVLEVGAGNGMNFSHYPASVERVVALEPEPYLRAKAVEAARRAPASIDVVEGDALALPFEDGAFDAVVFCLVLCSIPDPAAALSEARRVLGPGGEIRFLEHVRAPGGRRAWVQDRLDSTGIWPRMAGGCHCSRDTLATVAAAGLGRVEHRELTIGPAWDHTNPHVLGSARLEP